MTRNHPSSSDAATDQHQGQAHGFGKVILLGEHAVVHNHPALAAALPQCLTVTIEPSTVGEIISPQWGQRVSLSMPSQLSTADTLPAGCIEAQRALVAILRVFRERAPARTGALRLDGLRIHVDSTLPSGSGLGSSAAFSVAAATALSQLVAADRDAICTAADAAEDVFHGRASGLDRTLAMDGGVGLFTRASGLAPLVPKPGVPVRLAIGFSGRPRQTAAMVARVSDQLATAPEQTESCLMTLGNLARRGAESLVSGQLAPLGEAFDEAHSILQALHLSSPELDALCQSAAQNGALGSKLTGAGGGGAAIALLSAEAPPSSDNPVLAGWHQQGFEGFIADLSPA